jgi:hypothetical protein
MALARINRVRATLGVRADRDWGTFVRVANFTELLFSEMPCLVILLYEDFPGLTAMGCSPDARRKARGPQSVHVVGRLFVLHPPVRHH